MLAGPPAHRRGSTLAARSFSIPWRRAMPFGHKLPHRLALLKGRLSRGALLALVLSFVASCEKPNSITGTNPPPVTQLVVFPSTATLQPNQVQDFTAVGFTAAGDTAQIAVSWSASGGTVDTNSAGGRHYGHYHNASCGQYGLTATSTPGNLNASANITVACAPAPVATVTVSPASINLQTGQTSQLTPTLKDANGNVLTGRTVTWSSDNGSAATVNATGLVTATGAGSATITATSEGQSGTSGITVTPAAANKFVIGDRVQTTDVTNIRNAPALSGTLVGTQPLGAQGTVVAGPVLDAAGDQLIRWQIDFDQGPDGWAVQDYLVKIVPTVPVASVTVTPATASLVVGGTVQLTATPKDANGNPLTGRTIVWSSSDNTIATVNGSGLITGAGAGGPVTITATSEGQSGTATVTVSLAPVASVTVTPSSANVAITGTVQLTATPKDANGNPLTGRAISWSSSNNAIASVNGSGLVTGVAAGGPVTITATSEGQSGTASITVAGAPVASVTVTPASASVQAGQTQQLTATLKDANGNILTGRTVTWSSNNTSVATGNSS